MKVGVNRYQGGASQKVKLFRTDPHMEAVAIDRVQAHRARRDGPRAQQALEELGKTARAVKESWPRGPDLMPAVLGAVKAEGTLQEVMEALKGAFGYGFVY